MKNCRPVYFVVALHFVLSSCVIVQGAFVFSVRIQDYSNPSNKLADDSCCDEPFEPCETFGCSPYFDEFCLRYSGTSHDDWTTCTLGSYEVDISFIPATVNIHSSQAWPGAFQLFILLKDEDGFFDDTLARVFADVSLPVDTEYTDTQYFVGNHVTLGLEFVVICSNGYCGADCTSRDCTPQELEPHTSIDSTSSMKDKATETSTSTPATELPGIGFTVSTERSPTAREASGTALGTSSEAATTIPRTSEAPVHPRSTGESWQIAASSIAASVCVCVVLLFIITLGVIVTYVKNRKQSMDEGMDQEVVYDQPHIKPDEVGTDRPQHLPLQTITSTPMQDSWCQDKPVQETDHTEDKRLSTRHTKTASLPHQLNDPHRRQDINRKPSTRDRPVKIGEHLPMGKADHMELKQLSSIHTKTASLPHRLNDPHRRQGINRKPSGTSQSVKVRQHPPVAFAPVTDEAKKQTGSAERQTPVTSLTRLPSDDSHALMLSGGYMYDNEDDVEQTANVAYQAGVIQATCSSSPLQELSEGYMYDNDEEMEPTPNIAYQVKPVCRKESPHTSSHTFQEVPAAEGYTDDNDQEMEPIASVAYHAKSVGTKESLQRKSHAVRELPEDYMYDNDEDMAPRPNVVYQAKPVGTEESLHASSHGIQELSKGYTYDSDEEIEPMPNVAYQAKALGMETSVRTNSGGGQELSEGYMYDNDEEMEQRPNAAYQTGTVPRAFTADGWSHVQGQLGGYKYDNDEDMG